MARKRYNEEDILRLLREIDVHLHGGMDVVSACRTLDLSRNCAAPLTAYYALKENTHGKQTNSRI